MLPPPATLALPPPEQPSTTQAPLPSPKVSKRAGKTSDQNQGAEVAKGNEAIQ